MASSTPPARIGVFGGTFDPIHEGHLAIGRAAVEQARLDKLLFMVSARPPHKKDTSIASAEDRYAMVQAALENDPAMHASRLELDRSGPSYTAETLRELRREHPAAKLYLILGMDALEDLPGWREPEFILGQAHLLAVPRPGSGLLAPALDGHYDMLDFDEIDLSSTEVRQRIMNGERLGPLLPEPVRRYIEEHGIYQHCAR